MFSRRAFIPRPRSGPYSPGTRVHLSSYPLDYTLNLLDPPRQNRVGTVLMCGPSITIVDFDDGERMTCKTKALNAGEPPE